MHIWSHCSGANNSIVLPNPDRCQDKIIVQEFDSIRSQDDAACSIHIVVKLFLPFYWRYLCPVEGTGFSSLNIQSRMSSSGSNTMNTRLHNSATNTTPIAAIASSQ